MEVRRGIPVSPGYAIAEALTFETQELIIREKYIPLPDVKQEIEKFIDAHRQTTKELTANVEFCYKKIGASVGKILESHLVMLNDNTLMDEICSSIKNNRYSAAYAISNFFRKKIKALSSIGEDSFTTRIKGDFLDIEKLLLKNILKIKQPAYSRLDKEVIIIAHDLTPSQTLSLNKQMVKGIVADAGGKTSHSAIIASALGIPCVVGLESATDDITSGDKVIVDGVTGTIIVNPDEVTLKRYQAMQRNYYLLGRRLTKQYKQLPAITKDGTKIEVVANIGSPDEIPSAIDHGAEGVGLYRTEFIFFDNNCQPTEEIHMQEYRKAIQALGNKKLVIRTLDLGADKIPVDGVVSESNPFLGLRAIRLCFQRVDIFTTQLRAIYKVSNYGNVQIMFPMISTLDEILKIKEIISQVTSDLEEEGVPFDRNIKAGVMLETPAIMMSLENIIDEVDFVSIGTNDLVAYTMAVDRTNDKVAYLYQQLHPAILRMLKESIEICNKHQKPVSLCGEMSSEAMYTMLLIGLGLRSFSVVPPVIPEIKKVICSITVEEAKKIARKSMAFKHIKDAEEFLRTETRKIIPDML